MGLKQQLAEHRAEFVRKAPPGRDALYTAKVEELRAAFPLDKALSVGDLAPEFMLPSASGGSVSLSALLRQGPVVVTFYRGGWCPYCNLQLRAYQRALPEIKELGARLVAISPEMPDASLSTAEANALSFDVLSDVGNKVARSFGLVYTLPEELRAAMRSNNRALPSINGDESWELPLAATYVVAPDRRIALAFVEIDYRERLEPDDIVASLRTLRTSSAA
jgi:peroxiredoxin